MQQSLSYRHSIEGLFRAKSASYFLGATVMRKLVAEFAVAFLWLTSVSVEASAAPGIALSCWDGNHSHAVFVDLDGGKVSYDTEIFVLTANDDEYFGSIKISKTWQPNSRLFYDQKETQLRINRRTGAFTRTTGWSDAEMRDDHKWRIDGIDRGDCHVEERLQQKF